MKGKGCSAISAKGGSAVMKEAHNRKDTFKRGGIVGDLKPLRHLKKKKGEMVEDGMPSHRLDKPKRAYGGSVINNTGAPLSSAAKTSPPK